MTGASRKAARADRARHTCAGFAMRRGGSARGSARPWDRSSRHRALGRTEAHLGRNAKENGSNGTDHGRASVMFALGQQIAGGRVLTGGWPGLAQDQLEAGFDQLRSTFIALVFRFDEVERNGPGDG